jgi:periplasmic protein CpxP/Spy
MNERKIEMTLSPEATEAVQTELKRFAADLNLSEDQKTKLKTALESARERLDEVRKNNPDVTRADVIAKLKEVRGPLRERVTAFLTPEQLTKWDAEVAKAKAFLGYSG